jgi:hypothetical protein
MLYVSDSYEELAKKAKILKKRVTILNLWGNMCPKIWEINKMRWLRFEAKSELAEFIAKDLKPTLNKLK